MLKTLKPIIGYLCSYVPIEIIRAAGFIPIRIIPENYSHKGCRYLDANFCSYVLSIMSEAMDEKYKSLDGIVFANSCDGMRRLYDAWRYYTNYPKFIHFIDVPFTTLEEEYYYNELCKFKEHLEKHFSICITDEKLKEIIKIMNKTRKLALMLYKMRAEGKINPSQQEFFSMVELLYNPTFCFEEKAKEILNNNKKTKIDKKRLLISGTMLKTKEIAELVENAFIVYDDVCTGGRFLQINIEENNNPLKAIAHAYLNKVPCPRMNNTEKRLKNILKMIDDFSIDGVILYGLKFCDTFLFSAPYIKEELKKRNIPTLFVDGWFTPLSSAGLKTRIQAFLEMIGE